MKHSVDEKFDEVSVPSDLKGIWHQVVVVEAFGKLAAFFRNETDGGLIRLEFPRLVSYRMADERWVDSIEGASAAHPLYRARASEYLVVLRNGAQEGVSDEGELWHHRVISNWDILDVVTVEGAPILEGCASSEDDVQAATDFLARAKREAEQDLGVE